MNPVKNRRGQASPVIRRNLCAVCIVSTVILVAPYLSAALLDNPAVIRGADLCDELIATVRARPLLPEAGAASLLAWYSQCATPLSTTTPTPIVKPLDQRH